MMIKYNYKKQFIIKIIYKNKSERCIYLTVFLSGDLFHIKKHRILQMNGYGVVTNISYER